MNDNIKIVVRATWWCYCWNCEYQWSDSSKPTSCPSCGSSNITVGEK